MFAPRFFPGRFFPRRYFPTGDESEGPSPDPEVTGVNLPVAATVYTGRSISLLATVEGTGISQSVTWSIEAGDGSLSSASTNPTRYKAPGEPGTATVRATSDDDPDFYAECEIAIIAAPEGGAGTLVRNAIAAIIKNVIKVVMR